MAACKTTISAKEFAEIWKKYDADDNGYIEGEQELKFFLKDIAEKEEQLNTEEFRTTIMRKYDTNKDGRIDMRELAEMLNAEENFLFLIRTEGGPTSVEFIKIWEKYDANKDGYIEAKELQNCLRDMFAKEDTKISEEKIKEYAEVALKLFDRDGNGKLDFKEMIKMLPVASNDLENIKFEGLEAADFKRLFGVYDTNNDNTIEGTELEKLIGDMFIKSGKTPSAEETAKYRESIMKHCDINQDGKIQLSELTLVLQYKSC